MAVSKELGFPCGNSCNLKEQLVRRTLRNIRAQGHPYIELREDGKKLIFFCTLCLAPCYGDSSLFNHLKGNLHTQRLVTAKETLLKPNPWPFSDGVFFFYVDVVDQNKCLPLTNFKRSETLDADHRVNDSSAIVRYGSNLGQNVDSGPSQVMDDRAYCDEISCDQNLDGDGYHELVVPSVLKNDEVANLVVRHMGVGNIGARFGKKDGVSDGILKIWCEWMGKDLLDEDVDEVPEHDLAVVTFAYNYNLGRKGLLKGLRYLLLSNHSDAEDSCDYRAKKRKAISDLVDVTNQDDSSGEECQSSNNSEMKMILSRNENQLVHSRVLSSKAVRKEVRDQQRIAAERLCGLCQQKMLPDKDVAALLNRRTGKFVCSSRNLTGAFHVFHVSCLLHWILLCEVETYEKQSVAPKLKRKTRRKVKGKEGGTRGSREAQEMTKEIYSAFCPECQGTGIEIDREELEKPSFPLAKIFKYKIKLCYAHKEWMKKYEELQNCSLGLSFPPSSDVIYHEYVATMKLLHFYRANP